MKVWCLRAQRVLSDVHSTKEVIYHTFQRCSFVRVDEKFRLTADCLRKNLRTRIYVNKDVFQKKIRNKKGSLP